MVRPKSNVGSGVGVSNGNDKVRYKGVRMRKWGKWVAEVRQPNSRGRIWLGSYRTAEEAARAYDAAIFCLRGPSGTLNFPMDPPDIPAAGELSPSQIQEAAVRHARKSGEVRPQTRPGVESASCSIDGYSVRDSCLGSDQRTEEAKGVSLPGEAFYHSPGVWTL